MPTYLIRQPQAAEAPFGLSVSQQPDKGMVVLIHCQSGMSRVQGEKDIDY